MLCKSKALITFWALVEASSRCNACVLLSEFNSKLESFVLRYLIEAFASYVNLGRQTAKELSTDIFLIRFSIEDVTDRAQKRSALAESKFCVLYSICLALRCRQYYRTAVPIALCCYGALEFGGMFAKTGLQACVMLVVSFFLLKSHLES